MFHSTINFIPLQKIHPSFSKALAAVRVEVDCHHEDHPNFQRAQDLGWRGGWSQKYRVFYDGCVFFPVFGIFYVLNIANCETVNFTNNMNYSHDKLSSF